MRRGVFYTFMINYLFELMRTVTLTTLLGTFNMLASALGQNLLWGKISDRYKLRAKLIIFGESIAAVTYLIVYFTHKSLLNLNASFAAGLSLIFGLSLLEFFWSMSDVGWATLLTGVTTSKTRGKIVGILNFVASLGRMVGMIFAGFLYNDGEGFRQGTIFYIVVGMLFTSALIMLAASRKAEKSDAKEEIQKLANSLDRKPVKTSESLYKWFLISLVIIVVGASCVNQVFLIFLKLPEGINAKDLEVTFVLTAWTLGGMLTSLLSGWLADKIGRVKTLLLGLSLSILTPSFYAQTFNIPTMAAIYGLNGASFWMIQTVSFAFAGDIIPEDRRGRLFSIYNTVWALSWGPAGLFVGGPLADVQTSLGLPSKAAYANAFYASSFIVALGTLLFLVRVARQKPEVPKS
jgi:MFS family permease